MAKVYEGKISFEKPKWKIVFFNEEKKKDATLFCQPKVFSADFSPKEGEELVVEFERDDNPSKDAIKVRPKGTEWKENQGNAGDQLPGEFHNPYNFVPAPRRDTVTGELGDRPPCGHDRFYPDKYSGKLCVKMRVETPLLLPDTARMHYNNEHKSYPVRVDADGTPFINPTAIKGMLRAAYEAITNSRLSVFKDHDKELAYRAAVEDGIRVVPCRVEKSGTSMSVTLYTGSSDMEDDGGPKFLVPYDPKKGRQPMYAAWLRRYLYPHGTTAPMLSGATLVDEHENKVWAYVRKWKKGPFKFWNVIEVQPHSATPPTTNPADPRTNWNGASELDPTINGEWVEGYICHSNRNIKRKHDERVFFKKAGSTPDKFLLTDAQWNRLTNQWKTLIKDYVETEHKGLDPGVVLSRHIQKKEYDLTDGSLCYARVMKEGSPAHGELKKLWPGFSPLALLKKGGDNWILVELNPVMISRRLHQTPPSALLERTSHPAKLITQLSPADRVFGWVRQIMPKDDELTPDEKQLPKEKKDIGAYRGQIRIGAVECKSSDAIQKFGEAGNPEAWLPLQILGQPKPQQGRFYVAKNKNGEAQDKGLSNEQAGYNDSSNKGLRGRKVYPHHASTTSLGDYWFEKSIEKAETKPKFENNSPDYTQNAVDGANGKFFREYIRPMSDDRRDKQNRSIQGWVKKDTVFEFDIHVTNFSKAELGALLWLLQLEPNRFHRFGGGKPIGFGSVHLSLVEEIERGDGTKEKASDIRTGEELKQSRYASLDEDKPVFNLQQLENDYIKDFKKGVEEAYGKPFANVSFIKTFLRSCEGFSTGLPTHYPRTVKPPNPDGKSFEWFVANSSKDGLKLVLPNLSDDEGLPLNPQKA